MIPIVAWVDMANAVIAGVLALRLFVSYKKSYSRSIKLFFITYVFFALYMFFAAGAGLLTKNPDNMVYTNTLSFAFLYLASIMVIQIPFLFMKHDTWERTSTLLLAAMGAAGIWGIFTTSSPHEFLIFGPYVYWRPIMGGWVRILSGVIALYATITFITVFLKLRRASTDNPTVYRRSTHLAYGMICLLIGSVLNFVVGIATSFLAILAGTLIAGLGLIIMAEGILRAERQTEEKISSEKNNA